MITQAKSDEEKVQTRKNFEDIRSKLKKKFGEKVVIVREEPLEYDQVLDIIVAHTPEVSSMKKFFELTEFLFLKPNFLDWKIEYVKERIEEMKKELETLQTKVYCAKIQESVYMLFLSNFQQNGTEKPGIEDAKVSL